MGKRRIACLLLCLLLVLCTACGAQPDSDGALRCTVTIECGMYFKCSKLHHFS